MFPAARIGDPITHDQLIPSGTIAAPVVPCLHGTVSIEGLPAAHVGCTTTCSGAISGWVVHPPSPPPVPPIPLPPGVPPPPPPPAPPIPKGSATVFIHGKPAVRWSPAPEIGACGAFFGDAKVAALRTVFVGDSPFAASGGRQGAVMKQAKSKGTPFCEKCQQS